VSSAPLQFRFMPMSWIVARHTHRRALLSVGLQRNEGTLQEQTLYGGVPGTVNDGLMSQHCVSEALFWGAEPQRAATSKAITPLEWVHFGERDIGLFLGLILRYLGFKDRRIGCETCPDGGPGSGEGELTLTVLRTRD
jgi:hypothetical protein